MDTLNGGTPTLPLTPFRYLIRWRGLDDAHDTWEWEGSALLNEMRTSGVLERARVDGYWTTAPQYRGQSSRRAEGTNAALTDGGSGDDDGDEWSGGEDYEDEEDEEDGEDEVDEEGKRGAGRGGATKSSTAPPRLVSTYEAGAPTIAIALAHDPAHASAHASLPSRPMTVTTRQSTLPCCSHSGALPIVSSCQVEWRCFPNCGGPCSDLLAGLRPLGHPPRPAPPALTTSRREGGGGSASRHGEWA